MLTTCVIDLCPFAVHVKLSTCLLLPAPAWPKLHPSRWGKAESGRPALLCVPSTWGISPWLGFRLSFVVVSTAWPRLHLTQRQPFWSGPPRSVLRLHCSDALKAQGLATFGRLAFSTQYNPQLADEAPFRVLVTRLCGAAPTDQQMATMRRLFFASHTLALSDLRSRVEATPDVSAAVKKLPTAERVARQADQEKRLGGVIFSLVDSFVEMYESGILVYVKAEQCCSQSQEVQSVRKDSSIATDSSGHLKLSSKTGESFCEANTEIKLKSAWQRRSLAMDLANLASFQVIESWVQYLFLQLVKDQPRGFSKVTLQQLIECDKQMFIMASHKTMGELQTTSPAPRLLDEAICELQRAPDVLQYLAPIPAARAAPQSVAERPAKQPKTQFKGNKGAASGKGSNRLELPDGCVSHDSEGKPLCFAFQAGKCKFKGPAGKRCARGFHKCYQAGCFRLRPHHQCTHSD